MWCISVGVKIVLCAIISLVIVKLAADQQQARWHAKHILPDPTPEVCPDILTAPEMHVQWPNWKPYADQQIEEVATADEKDGFDVIFYGDSITEQWRGSAVGSAYPSMNQTHGIFQARFNKDYNSHVLAIAGDQIGHLWWRMLNGQLPARKHPKAVVILIGTNDLTADDCRANEEASLVAGRGIVGRIQEILLDVREHLPTTDIILLGLLPRDAHVLSGPPAYEWPNRMSKAIASINLDLEEVAEKDSKIHFLDCGAPFILPEGGLDSSILPDALHPNAGGMDLLASCFKPRLDSLISAHSAPAQGQPEGI